MSIDYLEKFFAIAFSLLILLNGFVIAKIARTWFTPSGIISIFWFAYTFFPLAMVFNAPVNALSVLYISLAIFFFTLSSYALNWRAAFLLNQSKLQSALYLEFHTRFLRYSFYAIQYFSIFVVFLDIYAQGFSINDIVFNLMETSSRYISLRYAEELNNSFLSRIGTVAIYVGVILGGLVFSAANTVFKKSIILFVALVPSLLIMVVQGAKGTLLLCVMFFYSTFLIYKLYVNDISLTDKKTNKNLFIIAVLLLPALISSFLSRGLYGYDLELIVERLLSYIASYAFAHVYAFSDFFSFYIGDPYTLFYAPLSDHYYGFYTFMSIFKAFGSQIEVPLGTFDEYYNYNDFLKTNVFTLFRGLILDFGLLGGLIFMFFLGAIANLSFYNLLCSRRAYFSIAFFAIMFGFYYTCFISIFIWNSIFVAFFIFAMLLIINRKIFVFRHNHSAE